MRKILTTIYSTIFLFGFAIGRYLVKNKPYPKVLSTNETIDYIIKNHASVARFGDGELELMTAYRSIHFQPFSLELRSELRRAANSDSCLICLPQVFDPKQNEEQLIPHAQNFWNHNSQRFAYPWKMRFKKDFYGNADLSRFYMKQKDKAAAPERVKKLQEIWQDRQIIFVEGEESRLGVGNDLFNNSKSVRRILAPAINAYKKIEQIEAYIKNNVATDEEVLFLLALGPTASLLAIRLAKLGYQAVDIGHVDIEYEWMKMGASSKVPIANKFVNEVGDGNNGRQIQLVDANSSYHQEIMTRI